MQHQAKDSKRKPLGQYSRTMASPPFRKVKQQLTYCSTLSWLQFLSATMRILFIFGILMPRTHSHKAISHQRRGLRRDWKGAQQLLNQLAVFALVINIFLLPPVLFIECTLNPLHLERGLYWDSSSLFCVHVRTFSPEQRLLAPVKLSRGSSSFFITTGPGDLFIHGSLGQSVRRSDDLAV
jgi:hypothetical protein